MIPTLEYDGSHAPAALFEDLAAGSQLLNVRDAAGLASTHSIQSTQSTLLFAICK
jgi:hypothetical protein